MTHMRPMAEHEGKLRKGCGKLHTCGKCGKETAQCEIWESSDEAYEDVKYTCQNPDCKYVWWVDGIDS